MTTERLRLTRPKATDAAGVFAILGDPQTVEHNPSDRLEDRAAAADLVSRWARHWEEHGFGYWCVRESGSDRIIEETIVARVRLDNRSSRQVALKVGLHRDATMDCQGEDGLDLAFRSPDTH